MTLGQGLDSAYAPTLAQVQAAKAAGYTWWGFYLPKLPGTDPLNGWTIAQMDVIRQGGLIPVPICVPAPPAPADAVQTATEYVNLARQYGCPANVSVCYNGEHIMCTGPVWIPTATGVMPTAVGPASALQWNTGTFGGLSVDFNASAPDFPAASALVCDLEHNVSYSSAWYTTFQQTVAKLDPPVNPPKPAPAPESGVQFCYHPNGVRKDMVYITADLHVHQAWTLKGDWSDVGTFDLGGLSHGPVTCAWAPNGQEFTVMCQGTNGAPYYRRWTAAAWGAWTPIAV